MTNPFISRAGTNPPEKRLYVFLHGLICLVDLKAPGFEAYLPDMGNDHVYLLGDWLLEKTITSKRSSLRLTGVNSGDGELDDTLDPVVRLPASFKPDTTVSIRAKISLPRPNTITYRYVQGKFAPNAFQGDTSKFTKLPNIVSGIRAFIYNFVDETQVGIYDDNSGEFFWQCPELAVINNTLSVAAVHIYNEPDQPLDNPEAHAICEFNQSLKLLGANVSLTNSATIPQPDPEQLDGCLPGETDTLDSRLVDSIHLLVSARTGQVSTGVQSGGGGGTQVCGGANGLIVP